MGVSSNTSDEQPGQGEGTGASKIAGEIDLPRLTPQGGLDDEGAGRERTGAEGGGAAAGQPHLAECRWSDRSA